MIKRDLATELKRAARQFPSITLTGPRQSGKTTLCRTLFPGHAYVTLEATDVRSLARDDPRGFLSRFTEGAIIDEVQRVPDLLSYLQGVIDEEPVPGRWILTGSQNLSLLESVSQSLAGRTAVHHLLPLSRGEVERFDRFPVTLEESLLAGTYPRIFDRGLQPEDWFRSYVATYLERDVRSINNVGDLTTFQRFVELCAGRSAQLVNYSSLASDCGVSQPTAKSWLTILETSFLVFRLPAFHANIRKRLVKMPKLHFYDTGLVCWLLGIRTPGQLRNHPLRGAIFETWVASEIMKHRINRGDLHRLSFYRDRNGVEVDLIIEHPTHRTLVEVKSAETVSSNLFAGLQRVQKHLAESAHPDTAVVVYGGDQLQHLSSGWLIPWSGLHKADFWKEEL
ncbi:MAG: ATP-binding protein [Gemmatimonadetes bacterium]|nr:ATP-binding protein [Gemmatimonadota bacterium]